MLKGLDTSGDLSGVLWMRATCGDTHSRLPTGTGVASAIGLAWMRPGSVTDRQCRFFRSTTIRHQTSDAIDHASCHTATPEVLNLQKRRTQAC
jgi:hypothetical protein